MAYDLAHFEGYHSFLSNFYDGEGGDVTINGIHYPTTEHAFQAGKFVKRSQRKQVAGCATPGYSKRFARAKAAKIGNRAGWKDSDISIYWMLKCLRLKFKHPRLAEELVKTYPRKLIEGNTWGDDFWGCVRTPDGWRGDNWLGKILMHIREELRHGKRFVFVPNNYRRDGRVVL